MNFSRFFAQRILWKHQRAVSRLTVRLAIGSLAIAIAVMEVALSLVSGFERAVEAKVVGFVSHIHIGYYNETQDEAPPPLPRNAPIFGSALRQAFPQVTGVAPYVGKLGLLRASNSMEAVYAKGVDSAYNWPFYQQVLTEGHLPVADSEVLVSRFHADRLLIKAGDEASLLFFDGRNLRRRGVVVAGIYETGMEEFDSRLTLCALSLIQGVNNWTPDQVSGFEVRLNDAADPDTTARAMTSALPMAYEARSVRQLFPEIFDWLQLQYQNVDFVLLLMAIVAIINLTSVVLILIIERTHTIGMLRAMGLTSRRIRRIFLWNMFYLMLAGLVLGNLIGLGLLASQHYWGWLKLDQSSYFVRTAPVAWVWLKFAAVNAGMLAVCMVCMLIPVSIISRISPLRAIRFS